MKDYKKPEGVYLHIYTRNYFIIEIVDKKHQSKYYRYENIGIDAYEDFERNVRIEKKHQGKGFNAFRKFKRIYGEPNKMFAITNPKIRRDYKAERSENFRICKRLRSKIIRTANEYKRTKGMILDTFVHQGWFNFVVMEVNFKRSILPQSTMYSLINKAIRSDELNRLGKIDLESKDTAKIMGYDNEIGECIIAKPNEIKIAPIEFDPDLIYDPEVDWLLEEYGMTKKQFEKFVYGDNLVITKLHTGGAGLCGKEEETKSSPRYIYLNLKHLADAMLDEPKPNAFWKSTLIHEVDHWIRDTTRKFDRKEQHMRWFDRPSEQHAIITEIQKKLRLGYKKDRIINALVCNFITLDEANRMYEQAKDIFRKRRK